VELSPRLADRLKLARHFFPSVRKRGVWRTLKISFYELYYDWKFRIKTGVVIPVSQIDGEPEALQHAMDYFPSSFLVLKEALLQGQADLRDAVFVDFGCGLGRALLFASELPLRRIIGVELSPTLCAAARQNMSSFYQRKKKALPAWSVVNSDARTFNIPDNATIFYFFNPFDAVVLDATVKRIIASVGQAPRDCMIVYANPIYESVISAYDQVKIQKRSLDYVIYRLKAANPVARSTPLDTATTRR
jgi:SAM-dependent methyltransferase